MRQRALVVGAGGFLGGWLVRELMGRGYHVLAVDRDRPGTLIDSEGPALAFHEMSLPHPRFHALLKEFNPTILVHAAGCALVPESVGNPLADFEQNVSVTAFLLDTIRKHSAHTRTVLLSSAAVYGSPDSLPVAETAPLRPISPYGYDKLMAETLADEYSRLFGLKLLVLRIFSAYGQGLQRQVIHDLCQKALLTGDDHIEVYGTGNETRDFIHARDIARSVVHLHEKNVSGIVNIGSGSETRIADVLTSILDALDIRKPIHYSGTVRQGDPLHWRADVGKLAATGFVPSVALSDGLRQYIEWFRQFKEGCNDTQHSRRDSDHRRAALAGRSHLR